MEESHNFSKFDVEYIVDSIKGKNKNDNEDNHLIIDELSIKMFLLFDGVGSSKNAKEATILAIDFIKNNFPNYLTKDNFEVKRLFFDTNNFILNSEISGALTTISCLIILPGLEKKFIVANLGDTRVYSFTNHSVSIMSTDDKLFYNSNIITKCLGMSYLSLNDINEYKFKGLNGSFIMCTDGFYNLFEENKIIFLNALNKKKHDLVSKKLKTLIEDKNNDDSSYIIIYC